jgi:hypothetical protein
MFHVAKLIGLISNKAGTWDSYGIGDVTSVQLKAERVFNTKITVNYYRTIKHRQVA